MKILNLIKILFIVCQKTRIEEHKLMIIENYIHNYTFLYHTYIYIYILYIYIYIYIYILYVIDKFISICIYVYKLINTIYIYIYI